MSHDFNEAILYLFLHYSILGGRSRARGERTGDQSMCNGRIEKRQNQKLKLTLVEGDIQYIRHMLQIFAEQERGVQHRICRSA